MQSCWQTHTARSVRNFWYPSLPSVLVTAARMMFFSEVLRLGASPDSRTTTPPSPDDVNWSLRRESNLVSEETFEPTVTRAVGIHPLHLRPCQIEDRGFLQGQGHTFVVMFLSRTTEHHSELRHPRPRESPVGDIESVTGTTDLSQCLPPESYFPAPTIAVCRYRIAIVRIPRSLLRSTRAQKFAQLIAALEFRRIRPCGASKDARRKLSQLSRVDRRRPPALCEFPC